MSITEKLAKFACNTDYASLPESVILSGKIALMDSLSAILAGHDHPAVKSVISMIQADCTSDECSIFLKRSKASRKNAALAHGTMALVHDIDDVNELAVVHPGSIIIPTVLSIAEAEKSNGKEILTAIVIGYDVQSRIALASRKKCGFSGWYISSLCGAFGAAAAAGVLLHLSPDEMSNALGISSMLASGNMQTHKEGANAFFLQAGWSAHNGIMAATLSKFGLQGPIEAIEGQKSGFYDLHFQDYDAELALSSLGERFEIQRTSIKPFASNRCTHSSITAVESILKRNRLEVDDIKEVYVNVTTAACNRIGHEPVNPGNLFSVKLSAPYCVAATMLGDSIGPDTFTDKRINDDKIKMLAQKIVISGDDEMDKQFGKATICPAKVKIVTNSGSQYHMESLPKGSPDNPLSREDVENKFISYVSPALTTSKCVEIIDVLREIETLDTLEELILALS